VRCSNQCVQILCSRSNTGGGNLVRNFRIKIRKLSRVRWHPWTAVGRPAGDLLPPRLRVISTFVASVAVVLRENCSVCSSSSDCLLLESWLLRRCRSRENLFVPVSKSHLGRAISTDRLRGVWVKWTERSADNPELAYQHRHRTRDKLWHRTKTRLLVQLLLQSGESDSEVRHECTTTWFA
jgi:hypothetical protein